MNKRLLKEDYLKIVYCSFSKEYEDVEKYYLSIIEDNKEYNKDIFLKLENVLNEWVFVCRKNARKNHLPDFDEAGNEVKVDFDAIVASIIVDKFQPILFDRENEYYKILMGGQAFKYRSVVKADASYFKWQIGIIDRIHETYNLKNELIKCEERLPDLVKISLPPFPECFDIEYLKDRVKLMQTAVEISEDFNKIINADTGENPLIFSNTILAGLYNEYNNVMFEDVDYQEFTDWFRVEPIGRPNIKENKETEFCGVLGIIEKQYKDAKKPIPVSNFAKWVEKIGISGYSTKKGRAANYKRKDKIR